MAGKKPLYVVIGAGPSGTGVTERLRARGNRVRVVTRSGQAAVAHGTEIVAADITDLDAAKAACAGAHVIFGCLGLPSYRGWTEAWPAMMSGMLAAAKAAAARLVFMDNLYMYGPVDGPLHEDLPLTAHGKKPAVRSRITRMWQTAHASGDVRAVAVRASDFFGPGVRNAILGDHVTKRAVEGKTANLLGDPAMAHTFTYVPDLVRALVDIGDADDDVYGQAWHVPSPPARPVCEVVELVYREAGHRPKMRSAPGWMLGLLGVFDPNMREIRELLFQWTRPYEVDHSKFAERFWADYTPLEDGVRATVRWFEARFS
jgi:nucleoside-diphosphate-sugar epimerase